MLLRVASRRCAAAAARRRPLSVAAAGDDGALMDALRRCDDIYRRDVAPVNEALHGPWSTPTSPRFTVIAPGASDADQDGPALVGDPDLGFEGLRKFGPGLIQRTQLKIRSGISPKNFMLVDSPGMIDSPGGRDDASSKLDRGYHFENAVKWFADRGRRAPLLRPDKPGTTGETLAILTNALAGQDHKLHIILNKADKFERIHDFARAYGALCWNLSKLDGPAGLDALYRKAYGAELVRGDEEANALWARVRDHLLRKLDAVGGASRVRAPSARRWAPRVLDHDVPALRRAAAPASYGGFPRDAPEP
ncbi:hypothetical protein JL720_10336 [Aureococcus anophagefferens]|nr:hypothetical protein JL720_10336 [Aureococcus anophagefferens]